MSGKKQTVLVCDSPGCDESYWGVPGERLGDLRAFARRLGWVISVPQPTRPQPPYVNVPQKDFCPKHFGGAS
jgi:hypothetical protein